MEKQTFISKIKDGAIAAMQKYGILASLTIAQAILESGWGESQLTKIANNLFGIKRWGYPNFVTLPTTEYANGRDITVNAEFRKYPSWEDSIADHTAFLLQNSRYKNLIGCKDYRQACKLIQQDGYATDQNYSTSLIRLIEQNNLQQFDNVHPVQQVNSIVATFQDACNCAGYVDKNGNKLAIDGDRGELTNSVINKILLKKGSKGLLVKWIQNRMIESGFSCGPAGADGDFGTCTLDAVEDYQSSKHLTVDGQVGPKTINELLK